MELPVESIGDIDYNHFHLWMQFHPYGQLLLCNQWKHFIEFHPHEQLHPCSQFQPSSKHVFNLIHTVHLSTSSISSIFFSIIPCDRFHHWNSFSSTQCIPSISTQFAWPWEEKNYIQTHIHLLSSLVANLHMWYISFINIISFMYNTSHLYSRFH
jgi:hypothetical protein